MSATPIPRSLALTLYGDLDLTTIKTFPFRKREVETKIIENNQMEINKAINAKLAEGKSVFIVAPRIEGEEANSVETLVEIYKKQFPHLVTYVHGKMSVEEKEEAIHLFKSGTSPILVATSVIEVGVDVKNAALMLIYSPLSFGLSQLHQLRGRIGRDGTKALCLLVTEDEEVDKLKILEESEDGFKIAEADLSLRGPGEIIGVKQAGIPHFNSLNLVNDYKLFQIAREDALMILNHSENPEFKAILNHAKKEINSDIFTNV
jgi:ATP-dependent DNA helicase RecG